MNKKDIRHLLKQATLQGAVVTVGRNNHHRVLCPNGAIVVIASSPSDHRAAANIRAMLRRQGITV